MTPLLHLRNITYAYRTRRGDPPVLPGVDLDVAPGTFVTLVGPSGSGKSTLLHVIGLLDRATSGTCRFDGRDVDGMKEKERAALAREAVAFVFQAYNLSDDLTVAENVAEPLRYQGVPAPERLERVAAVLGRFDLTAKADRNPGELSGGQQQFAGVARARDGVTVVHVTHSERWAAESGRVVALLDGPAAALWRRGRRGTALGRPAARPALPAVLRLALVLAALLPAAAAAQTAVPLAEALRLAEAQAADVLRADAGVQAARAAVDAAAGRRWPALALRAGGGQRYGLTFDQTTGNLTQATTEALDVGLDADVVVYDGGARAADARAAAADLEAARLDRAHAARRAQAAVVGGYLDAAAARASAAVAEADLAAQRELLAAVEGQVAWGERAAAEGAQQQERVAAAEGALLTARRDLALAAARLVRLLGLDPAADYAFPAPEAPDETLAAGVPAPELGALLREAWATRADLGAAEAAVRAAEAEGRAARAGRRPTVALGIYAGTGFTSAAEAGLFGQLGDNRAGGLRVAVSLPLLDRGAAGAAVARAEAQAAARRAAAEDGRRQVALDVREQLVRLDGLAARAATAAARVRAAQTALAAERARYDAGDATLSDVTLLQARLTEALAEQALVGIEAAFAPVLLDLAVGR